MSGGMSELRDSGIMIQLAHQAMQAMGIDTDDVWQRMGITSEFIDDREVRTPHSAQRAFWKVMEEVTGDADIGLHLAENMNVYKGQVLQYLFLSSPTFGDGLNRALNYQLRSTAAPLILYVVADVTLSACIGHSPQVRMPSELFGVIGSRKLLSLTS